MKIQPLGLGLAIALTFGSGAIAQQTDILMLDDPAQSGFLWTSSFQRIDGSTCAWIEYTEGALVRLIYGNADGGCRSVPTGDALTTYDYSGMSGDRIQFSGADFDVLRNTGSMLSGSWNHVSYQSDFDTDNVVFRNLPTN